MTDLELLDGLWTQYREELTKRAQGIKIGAMRYRPNNKCRLSRLRLEIQALMLKMERKMTAWDNMDHREGWE